MKYLNQSELDAGLAKWVRILHLQDWEINATLVSQTQWEERTQCGECSTRLGRYAADIKMASFETMDLVSTPNHADMERTLVHELLHCVFRSSMLWAEEVKDGTPQSVHYEHAIEQTARAFVELDRA